MFKWFVGQLGAGETRARQNGVSESVAGRPGEDARLIWRLLARRAAAEGAPCSAVPDAGCAPAVW